MRQTARRMTCCCCGSECYGVQHWNRDDGFGLCLKCADWIGKRETPEQMERLYGVRGVNYGAAREAQQEARAEA